MHVYLGNKYVVFISYSRKLLPLVPLDAAQNVTFDNAKYSKQTGHSTVFSSASETAFIFMEFKNESKKNWRKYLKSCFIPN